MPGTILDTENIVGNRRSKHTCGTCLLGGKRVDRVADDKKINMKKTSCSV